MPAQSIRRADPIDLVHPRAVRWTGVIALLTVSALAACSSTQLVTKWQSPSIETISFTKIVALAFAPRESQRRAAEAALCQQVTSIPCRPAYLAIAESEMGDVQKMKAAVQRDGFDGALVFRVVSADEKVTYVPPTYGPTFWGYYGYANRVPAAPAYYRKDKLVRVETSIYSLREDRLLWVGTTETLNPDRIDSLVEEVAVAVRKELERANLIPAR